MQFYEWILMIGLILTIWNNIRFMKIVRMQNSMIRERLSVLESKSQVTFSVERLTMLESEVNKLKSSNQMKFN